jgi:2,3-bisphosphoglycerate-independent phosphoglycerate mutase
LKKEVIEALDRGIGKAIEPFINDPKVVLFITSDHSTPSSSPLIHSGEPVPLTIYGQGVRRDTVRRYDEIHVAGGALGTVRGQEMMYLILNHLDRIKLTGIMDTPDDQPYWPGRYQPFQVK